MSDGSEAYRAAGVDLQLGNDVSKMLYEAAKYTWADRIGRIGEIAEYGTGFASFRGMPLDSIGAAGYVLSASADGIGTKVEVAERMQRHDSVGHDLVAMSCDDAVVRGGEPFAIATVLDVRTFKDIPDLPKTIGELAIGYVEAAKAADVTIANGETAELGNRIGGFGPFNYNWSSTALWVVHRDRIIDETKITPGDSIVGFKEHGFRSNGMSLVRNTFAAVWGEGWHSERISEDGTWHSLGDLVLRPSIIYSKAVVDMTGGSDLDRDPRAVIHGAAHVTGGGIPEKLGRVLANTGYGAVLDALYEPPHVMQVAQKAHNEYSTHKLTDKGAYRTWNMGQGMLVITPTPAEVIAVAETHGITAGVVGEVTANQMIKIISQGQDTPGWQLEFEPHA